MRLLQWGITAICLAWVGSASAQTISDSQVPVLPVRGISRIVGDQDEGSNDSRVQPAAYKQYEYAGEQGFPSVPHQSLMSPACGTGMCDSPSCTTGAPSCTSPICDPPCGYNHCWYGFAEALYLRPRDSEVAYGVVANGPINGPVPGTPVLEQARLGIVDNDYSPGFRVGAGKVLDCYSSIGGQYTWFDSHTDDAITANQANNLVVIPLVLDPGLQAAQNQTYDTATARMDISFNLIDLDYRFLFACTDMYQLTFLGGVRYANLTQNYSSNFIGLGNQFTNTNIDFSGFGGRVGMEAERYVGTTGLYVSGKGYASLLAGEFGASYRTGNNLDAEEVNTSWRAGRMVTQIELEIAAGWANENDTLRFQVGYMFNSWYNMLKTNEWINAIQNSNYVDPSANFNGLMTFDGITARVEGKF